MEIIKIWLYYSKFYILGSILITYLLNRVTDKLYYPPLIINMVSVILLFIAKDNRTYNMYVVYMPVVISSAIFNILVYIYRKS